MLFQGTYVYSTDHRDTVRPRFKETGAPPPPGVDMLGRWHNAAGNGGFFLVETDDPVALARWLQEWTDVIDFEVVPVVTDEQVSEVIG